MKRIKDKYFNITSAVRQARRDTTLVNKVQDDFSRIEESGFFDKSYYLKKYPDIVDAGVDPLWHFFMYGGKEYRNPSKHFDSSYYARVQELLADHKVNPLVHYLNTNSRPDKKTYSVANAKVYREKFKKGIIEVAGQFKNLVVMESMSWDGELQQRPHHLARLLALHEVMVVYIDRGYPHPEKIADGLYVVPDQDFIYDLEKAGTKNMLYWLFSTTPIRESKIKKLKGAGYGILYDYIDDISEDISGDISNQLAVFNNLEEINPVILVASARNLKAQLEERFPNREVLLCQNAVDENHFNFNGIDSLTTPTEMKALLAKGKPIVGFYGAIAPWLDYNLINNITETRQDLQFVFIGIDYNGGLSKLIIRDNVHFLGPKEYSKLPNYSQHFDCALIPFLEGDIAKSTSPVKLYEYMAMGIPTVCTKDLQECYGYKYVHIAQDKNDFNECINKAIAEKRSSKARSILYNQSMNHTWSAMAQIAKSAMDKL